MAKTSSLIETLQSLALKKLVLGNVGKIHSNNLEQKLGKKI